MDDSDVGGRFRPPPLPVRDLRPCRDHVSGPWPVQEECSLRPTSVCVFFGTLFP